MGVTGGDGTYDATANLIFEAGGPLEGAAASRAASETLSETLHASRNLSPAGSLHIRAPPAILNTLAGLRTAEKYGTILHLWKRLRAHHPGGWLSRADPHRGLIWADRAHSIAQLCLAGATWADVSTSHAHRPRAPPPTNDACAVCLEDFVDPLPTAAGTSPTATGFYHCRHAICPKCERAHQRSIHGSSCPLCRSPRAQWMPLRP